MIWGNRDLWTRIGVVAGAVWIGLMVIVSATHRNFEWIEPYSQAMGPALIVTGIGIAIIAAISLGVPWIYEALHTGKKS